MRSSGSAAHCDAALTLTGATQTPHVWTRHRCLLSGCHQRRFLWLARRRLHRIPRPCCYRGSVLFCTGLRCHTGSFICLVLGSLATHPSALVSLDQHSPSEDTFCGRLISIRRRNGEVEVEATWLALRSNIRSAKQPEPLLRGITEGTRVLKLV